MSTAKKNASLDVNDTLNKSEAFFIKYKKEVLGGIIAVIVLVGGFFATKYLYLQPREEKASALCALGQTYFMSNDFETALNGNKGNFPGYVKIASEYGSTDAGNLANAYAGICYAKMGQTKKAIASLEDYSTKGDETLSPAILGTLANCYATDGQVDKAIETFKDAAKQADNASLSPVFLIEAGKLLESQKKNAEALAIYQQVKEDYPTSMQAAPVQQNGKIIPAEIDKYIERVSQ